MRRRRRGYIIWQGVPPETVVWDDGTIITWDDGTPVEFEEPNV